MEIQFAKWGNSIALRIPSKVAAALGITAGSVADLDLRRGKFIVVPHANSFRLDDLVSGITADNLHQEIESGTAFGAEVID